MSADQDDKKKIEIDKAHCNTCLSQTNHWIRASYFERHEDEDHCVWGSNNFQILQCCGCEEVKFRRSEQFSEWEDYETNARGETVPVLPIKQTYFPPAKWRMTPRWMHLLFVKDEVLHRIHEEVYTAIQANSLFLAGAGSRALIDRILIYTVGDEGTFRGRLESLAKKGFIAEKDVETIETALEAGHASAHRGWIPTREAIETVMNIIENLIERVYVLSDSAKSLRPQIPSRSSKKD